MKIVISKHGEGLYIEGAWMDAEGIHSKRLNEDVPGVVQRQIDAIVVWAEGKERELVAEVAEEEDVRRIDEQIGKLQERRRRIAK